MPENPFEGFRRWAPSERIRRLARWAELTPREAGLLRRTLAATPGLPQRTASRMIENVAGVLALPLGLATHFLVNGREHVVPMAIEEPSVVAAASHAAKLARPTGGFRATAGAPLMIGQVHLRGVKDPVGAADVVIKRKGDVLHAARDATSSLERRGAGPVDLEVRVLRVGNDAHLVVHLLVDVGDAMGANAVNTRCERAARFLERVTGGRARLAILSNLADRRLAHAEATFAARDLGGASVVEGIVDAYGIAMADPYRCATHNKGIMNGIDALAVATGNDWRALEAGAHAYAAKSGRYESLTRFARTPGGDLFAEIALPLALGTVGGSTRTNPVAALALKLLRVDGARQLAEVAASLGLAQNVAALRALVTEGIQAGHMRLHRRLKR